MPRPKPPASAVRPRFGDSLSLRILAINIVALVLVGGSIFYLDAFRARLVDERRAQEEGELAIVGSAVATAPPRLRAALITALGTQTGNRLRMYGRDGTLITDSWTKAPRTYRFIDPETQSWDESVGRWIDAAIDRIVRANIPLPFVDQGRSAATAWPELIAVAQGADVASRVRLAPDRTLVISAAIPVDRERNFFLLSVQNARDVTQLVRAERLRLGAIVGLALLLSIAMSLYLARTIVVPLRHLARAATQVRMGRARDVTVPRLPSRNDEIGQLARAVSDMTQALRQRIDATEAFAADVAHELKNPLASLSSAVESLMKVDSPQLRAQLLGVIGSDVRRLDRLITDIADASRLDAELSRSQFSAVDLAALARQCAENWMARDKRVHLGEPIPRDAIVTGDPARLARVIDNLIDNAVSFTPPGGKVRVTVTRSEKGVAVAVDDDGPGVQTSARAIIFERFHSDRPEGEAFGDHSGLGLAIAKTIIEGHNGSISIEDSDSTAQGARFVVRLPVRE